MLEQIISLLFFGAIWLCIKRFGAWRIRTRERSRTRRALDGIEVTRVARCREGEIVALRGRIVTADPPIATPLHRETCVAFRLWVDQRKGRVRRDRVECARAVRFSIDDGTGRAMIDPGELAPEQLYVQDDIQAYTQVTTVKDEPVFEELGVISFVRHGLGRLAPGQLVTVVGLVVLDPTPAGHPARIRIVPPPEAKRFILAAS